MNPLPTIPNLNAFAGQLRIVQTAGRILLALTALLLITMPATQHFWNWDHFLRGGHDFELGTLMVLSLISLAIVLATHCKECVDSLFASWSRLRFFHHDSASTKTPESTTRTSRLPCCTAISNFPLQI